MSDKLEEALNKSLGVAVSETRYPGFGNASTDLIRASLSLSLRNDKLKGCRTPSTLSSA